MIIKDWEEIKVEDSCILCNRKFDWHEQIIVKLPEWTSFWLCCSSKTTDKTEYEMPECWSTVQYEKDLKFVFNYK